MNDSDSDSVCVCVCFLGDEEKMLLRIWGSNLNRFSRMCTLQAYDHFIEKGIAIV